MMADGDSPTSLDMDRVDQRLVLHSVPDEPGPPPTHRVRLNAQPGCNVLVRCTQCAFPARSGTAEPAHGKTSGVPPNALARACT